MNPDIDAYLPSFWAAPLSVIVLMKMPSFSSPASAPTPIPMMLRPRPDVPGRGKKETFSIRKIGNYGLVAGNKTQEIYLKFKNRIQLFLYCTNFKISWNITVFQFISEKFLVRNKLKTQSFDGLTKFDVVRLNAYNTTTQVSFHFNCLLLDMNISLDTAIFMKIF